MIFLVFDLIQIYVRLFIFLNGSGITPSSREVKSLASKFSLEFPLTQKARVFPKKTS